LSLSNSVLLSVW